MSLNQVVLNGRIPHFEGTFKAADGDKKAFLSYAISVKRDFKPQDAQYYPEDLINFKAFGPKAEFINKQFSKGDGLILTGRLQKDDDYNDKDGNPQKGQLFLLVENVSFAEGTSKNGGDNASASSESKAPSKRPAPGKPAAPKSPIGGARTPGNKPW